VVCTPHFADPAIRPRITHPAPMADLRPPEPAINGAVAAPAMEAPGAEAGGAPHPAPPYSKRRRRPSVRLGDIDAPPPRRSQKPPSSASHPRPPRRAHPDDGGADPHHRRGPKPPAQPPRRTSATAAPAGADVYEDDDERYYDDEYHSDPAAARARVSSSGDESDGVADWGLPNGRLPSAMGYSGVRAWLDGLGLSRYAPVFEIHEVDDEVLPLLTLEDLKDMGVGAVGSRRKMYAAIQKLNDS
jgi:hypothetical protein